MVKAVIKNFSSWCGTEEGGSGGQQRGGPGGPPLLGPVIGVEDRGGRVTELGGELVGLDREVQADADYRPAVLGAGLDEDAG